MFAEKYRHVIFEKMLPTFMAQDTEKTLLHYKLGKIAIAEILDLFVRCADDINFEETCKVMTGFATKGFYRTLTEVFGVDSRIIKEK